MAHLPLTSPKNLRNGQNNRLMFWNISGRLSRVTPPPGDGLIFFRLKVKPPGVGKQRYGPAEPSRSPQSQTTHRCTAAQRGSRGRGTPPPGSATPPRTGVSGAARSSRCGRTTGPPACSTGTSGKGGHGHGRAMQSFVGSGTFSAPPLQRHRGGEP